MSTSQLDDARCLLIAHEPWYGHAAMRMTWIPTSSTDTMGVRVVDGGEVQCLYSAAFVAELTVPELYAVIQHEVEHVIRCHCLRHDGLHPAAWNIAADMTVNGPKQSPRIGYQPSDGMHCIIPFRDTLVWIPELWRTNENAEYYYRRIIKLKPASPGTRKVYGTILDDHSIWQQSDISPFDMAELSYQIATDADKKSRGHMPGHLRRVIRDIGHAQLPWQVLLERYLGRYVGGSRHYAYTRRNRRRDEFGVPGYVRHHRPHVSVIVDVSGSISPNELSQFFTELERICANARVDVLLWDTTCQGFTRDYRRGGWKTIVIRGGGGTDMAAPYSWLLEQRLMGDCVVLLTDGCCNWPDPQCVPLISVISRAHVKGPPWGKVLWLTPCAYEHDDCRYF